MSSFTFSAPAKINPILRVVGKRPDGYHLLETVMVFFPLFDRLTFTPCPSGIDLVCDPPVTGAPEENLAHRAAAALRKRCGIRRGAVIRLEKRIPHAAGLGGGSSDAATALLALNRLWECDLSLSALIDLGVGLGADVPIFLGGEAALAEGIGEKLTPLPDFPIADLVLANPGVPLATASVFKAFSRDLTNFSGGLTNGSSGISLPDSSRAGAEEGRFADLLENHLQRASQGLEPAVTELLDAFDGALGALMSGSGPSVFAVYPSRAAAEAEAERLAGNHPTWRVHSGRSFNRHPFEVEWAGRLS